MPADKDVFKHLPPPWKWFDVGPIACVDPCGTNDDPTYTKPEWADFYPAPGYWSGPPDPTWLEAFGSIGDPYYDSYGEWEIISLVSPDGWELKEWERTGCYGTGPYYKSWHLQYEKEVGARVEWIQETPIGYSGAMRSGLALLRLLSEGWGNGEKLIKGELNVKSNNLFLG